MYLSLREMRGLAKMIIACFKLYCRATVSQNSTVLVNNNNIK